MILYKASILLIVSIRLVLIFLGKGRSLVVVLYGPLGTRKTLTAKGIVEILKKPLYISFVASKFRYINLSFRSFP